MKSKNDRHTEQELLIKTWAIESAINPIAISDLQGNIDYVNPAFLRLWGYDSPAEVQGRSTIEFWKTAEKAQDILRDLGVTGGWIGELEAKAKNGVLFHVQVSASLIKNTNGEPIRMMASFEDISSRKQAEQALRRSEERFSAAFKTSPYAYMIANMEDGAIIEVNDAFAAISGVTREEALASSTLKLNFWVNTEDRKRMVNLLRDSGVVERMETQLQAKNGNIATVLLFARAIRLGNRPCIISIIEDITERKRVEEDLRKSELINRSIIASSPMGMHQYELMPDGRLVFAGANPAADTILGVDNSTFIGKTIEEAFPPLAATEVPDRYREVAKTGVLWQTEQIEYNDANISGAFQVVAFRTGAKKMAVMFMDITKRKQAENALRISEERYRRLVETTDTGYVIIDGKGIVLDANSEYLRLSGHTQLNDVLGRSVVEWTSPEEKKANAAALEACMKNGFIRNLEITYLDKNGKKTPVEINATMIEMGGAQKIVSLCRDITGRKKAEDAQKQTASLLRATLESTADGILVVDLSGKVASYNRKFGELWRIPGHILETSDDAGLLSFILDQLKDPEQFLAKVKDLYGQPHQESFDTIEFKDGRVFERYSQPQRVGDQIIGRVWSFRDITERRKTVSLLMNAQKLESLGVLAGGIAHDFNNLLTGIFGYIDLARSMSKEAKTTEYLETTLSTLNRARALTLQLLTFAKGGSPVQKLTPLVPFIQEAAQFALSGSNVSCRFDLAENLWPCNIDKNQIGQVVDNIVINAQQAIPDGGSIEISAVNISLGHGEHAPLSKGDYVKVSIKDFGIGIPKEIMPRIFDPFYTTKAKGHGLGLAICYSIVHRHGGCIEVESEPGKGSTFHVYLPATPETVKTNAAMAAGHKGSGTIIVMDDEEVVRETLKKMLESLGYAVVSKLDGRQVIDFYISETRANRTFTAMIFDLTVPGGMGGIEAAKEIRKLNREIPVFMISGYADDFAMKNPGEHGFTASISKPFTIAELSEMLNNNLKP